MTELTIDRANLREEFQGISDTDLLEAAEIAGAVAKAQKEAFSAAKKAFETAQKAANINPTIRCSYFIR